MMENQPSHLRVLPDKEKEAPKNLRKSADALAYEMLQTAEALTATVMAQREEILTAFVAKYGFHPDEAMQINKAGTWCVIKIDPEEVHELRRAIILDRIAREKVTRWQSLCLWLAGYK